MTTSDWLLPGAAARQQSVTADWTFVDQPTIDGVAVQEVRHVPTGYGHLTEVFRTDWGLDDGVVDQVFQSVLQPGSTSAWHPHEQTTDRIFVNHGRLHIVLFDARPGSPTHGNVIEFRAGDLRPMLIVIPAQVWHGVRNEGSAPASLLNLVDRAYEYDGPDHWSLPPDTDQIPFNILG